MTELTAKDRQLMKKIKFRRSHDGLYFSYFETKEEAFLYLKKLVDRYKFSPAHRNTITELCQEARDEGIMLWEAQVGNWIRTVFGIDIKPVGRPKKQGTENFVASISEDSYGRLRPLAKMKLMSRFTDSLFRANMRLPTKDLFIIMDELTVWIFFYKGEARAIHLSAVSKYEHQLIQAFCDDAERHGLLYVKERAERLGYKTLGATDD